MKKRFYVLLSFLFLMVKQVSAHGDGPTGHVNTDPLSILIVVGASLSASLVPLVLGYLSFHVIKDQKELIADNYLIPLGLSFGVLLFLLFDYASLSSIFVFYLSRIVFQSIKIVIVVFTLYVLALFVARDEATNSINIFLIWSLGIFIHTFGEGIIMGYNLTLGIGTVFEPFSITSYMMHKYAEGVIAAVLFVLAQSNNNSAEDDTTEDIGKVENSLLYKTAGIAGFSILPGALLGYLAGELGIGGILNTTNILVFTVGFAITAFIIPAMIPVKRDLYKENYFLAVALGLVYMYLGVILHNI